MVEIRISPERLRSVASNLDQKRQEGDQILATMIQTVNNLSGEWSGLAQVDYANLFNERVPAMRSNLNEILENLIQALRHIADEFERVDQQVI
ncbi:MAG: WXG100 family type VII secretion target [Anaerolineae bacterium]|jgi:WXG100 family type VII secretion target